MEAKELMFGDIILRNFESGVSVPYKIELPIDFKLAEREGAPIMLTFEMLKLNGWVNRTDENFGDNSCIVSDIFKGRNRWHPKMKQEEFCLISFYNNTFGLLVCGVIQQLEYVHELQHALRVCGLSDIADNFKVA